MDITGAEYGYPGPLSPWLDFALHRSSKINRESDFGYVRRQVYRQYGSFPLRHTVAHTIEKLEVTKALEERIPAWAQERGGKLNPVLRGTDVTFKQAKDILLDQIVDHFRLSMVMLYSPEYFLRRVIEIESQLAKNLANLDSREWLEGLTSFMASTMGGES